MAKRRKKLLTVGAYQEAGGDGSVGSNWTINIFQEPVEIKRQAIRAVIYAAVRTARMVNVEFPSIFSQEERDWLTGYFDKNALPAAPTSEPAPAT